MPDERILSKILGAYLGFACAANIPENNGAIDVRRNSGAGLYRCVGINGLKEPLGVWIL